MITKSKTPRLGWAGLGNGTLSQQHQQQHPLPTAGSDSIAISKRDNSMDMCLPAHPVAQDVTMPARQPTLSIYILTPARVEEDSDVAGYPGLRSPFLS